MQFIAEVKTHSPFGWKAKASWDELFEVAREFGDMISIHTDSRWHGSFDLIRKARQKTNKPILAKGIHESDSEIVKALSAGADYVLVVGRMPGIHIDKCLIEPNNLVELGNLDQTVKAVWNSRDLSSGGLKSESFDEARRVFPGWLCQASNIATVDDVDKSADAVLIGTNLVSFVESLKKSQPNGHRNS
jgi:indole-3-glycerol phosphate synthase